MEVSGQLCASVTLLRTERDDVIHLIEGWVDVRASLTFRSTEYSFVSEVEIQYTGCLARSLASICTTSRGLNKQVKQHQMLETGRYMATKSESLDRQTADVLRYSVHKCTMAYVIRCDDLPTFLFDISKSELFYPPGVF